MVNIQLLDLEDSKATPQKVRHGYTAKKKKKEILYIITPKSNVGAMSNIGAPQIFEHHQILHLKYFESFLVCVAPPIFLVELDLS